MDSDEGVVADQVADQDVEVSVRELARLPGFAEKTARMLVGVGMRSPQDLDRVGPVPVFLRLRATYPGVNFNFLWGLEALDAGCDWRDLTPARKAELRAQVEAAERNGPVSSEPGEPGEPGA